MNAYRDHRRDAQWLIYIHLRASIGPTTALKNNPLSETGPARVRPVCPRASPPIRKNKIRLIARAAATRYRGIHRSIARRICWSATEPRVRS